jgi:hypothetical protein
MSLYPGFLTSDFLSCGEIGRANSDGAGNMSENHCGSIQRCASALSDEIARWKQKSIEMNRPRSGMYISVVEPPHQASLPPSGPDIQSKSSPVWMDSST